MQNKTENIKKINTKIVPKVMTLENKAFDLLNKMSGINRASAKLDQLIDMRTRTRKMINEHIRPVIVCSYYEDVHFEGRYADIGGINFECSAFEQISPESVKGAYAYFMTVGDFSFYGQPIMEQLFADMWGTAFVDALRMDFAETLKTNCRISDGFGPGLYGMNVLEIKKVAQLVNPSLAGITVRHTGIMLPQKSCAGIYFEINDKYDAPPSACRDCVGALSNCTLCNAKKNNRSSEMLKCTGICSECGKCKNGGMLSGVNNRKTKMTELPYDFTPETDENGYGIAFDIGTTTIVGMLWDIAGGKVVSSLAKTNPQNEHGIDVISRITFVSEDSSNLEIMRSSIIECLNKIIFELCSNVRIKKEAITRVVICGNTTMSHIFAGYDPSTLAKAPFAPAYTGPLILSKAESRLDIGDGGIAVLLPNIAGHVGGDITAGILATRLLDQKKQTLFIDIGTNGEIALHSSGKTYVCSTAAGPAFEGASIYQGMRAAPGAIERVQIDGNDVLFNTIENVPPKGICGSGLIDVVAEMIKNGIINRSGRICSAIDYNKKHPKSLLGNRLCEDEKGRFFILVYREFDEDIVITQNDIREVQLAKGAVATGIAIMLDRAGSTSDKIENVIVAGAFGNYIDKKSAIAIGLLPDIQLDRVHFSGNSAGAGCLMALASAKEALNAQKIPQEVCHIELAEAPEFQEKYIDSMMFN